MQMAAGQSDSAELPVGISLYGVTTPAPTFDMHVADSRMPLCPLPAWRTHRIGSGDMLHFNNKTVHHSTVFVWTAFFVYIECALSAMCNAGILPRELKRVKKAASPVVRRVTLILLVTT